MMLDTPLVSVCVQTYQHAPYIAKCLEGIVSQKTNFSFEVILGEDESTDGTRDVCIEFARKYPTIISLFLRSRKDVIFINNRPTGRYNLVANLEVAKGKYIALCEGDDYWIDENKLQQQVDFLEQHPDYAWCYHDAYQLYEHDGKMTKFSNEEGLDEYTTTDVIRRSGGFFHTASVLFRADVIRKLPPFFMWIRASDWALVLLASLQGKGKFLRQKMSVYRVHQGGIFSSIKNNNRERIKAFKSDLILLHEFDRYTNYAFKDAIARRKRAIRNKIVRRYIRVLLGRR